MEVTHEAASYYYAPPGDGPGAWRVQHRVTAVGDSREDLMKCLADAARHALPTPSPGFRRLEVLGQAGVFPYSGNRHRYVLHATDEEVTDGGG